MRRRLSFLCCIFAVVIILQSRAHLLAQQSPQPTSAAPIFADLKASATAEWINPIFDTMSCSIPAWGLGKNYPPALRISVDLRGKAAAEACSYGEVRVESMLDENGKSYRWPCMLAVARHGLNDMSRVLQSDLNRNGNAVSFTLGIPNRPPIRSIRELRGSIALKTGGQHAVVIPGAFKNLGEPIKDKNLKALGIEVTVVRRHRPEMPKARREEYTIDVGCDVRDLTGCEILDAEEELIIDDSPREEHWAKNRISLDFSADRVPANGRLRLIVHRDARTIRVPFVLRDIPVPVVPGELDIPACREDQYVEAVPVLPGDPAVADLKITAESDWSVSVDGHRALGIYVALSGQAVKRIGAYGEFELQSVKDPSGNAIEVQCDLFNDMEMMSICSQRGTFRAQEGKIALPVCYTLDSPKAIRELRGSIALEMSDRFETVTIKGIAKGPRVPLQDERLKALRISGEAQRQNESGSNNDGFVDRLDIDLQWGRNTVVGLDVLDAKGGPMKSGRDWFHCLSVGGIASWGASFKNELPPDVQLRIRVQKDSKKIRVPFVIKDIKVP